MWLSRLSALQLADALRARGLERDADAALAVALEHGQQGQGVCAALASGFRRAEERALVGEQERLTSCKPACAWTERIGGNEGMKKVDPQFTNFSTSDANDQPMTQQGVC
jgi:hypothetical protein